MAPASHEVEEHRDGSPKRSRGYDRDKDLDREREWDRGRDRDREPRRERDRESRRERDREPERERDREPERERDREPERERDRYRDRKRYEHRERNQDRRDDDESPRKRRRGDDDSDRWRGGKDDDRWRSVKDEDRWRSGEDEDRWRVGEGEAGPRDSRRRATEQQEAPDKRRRVKNDDAPDAGAREDARTDTVVAAAAATAGPGAGDATNLESAAQVPGGGQEPPVEPVVRKPVVLGKTGGVYIPPFKLARMMADTGAQSKSSPEYQRLAWEALKKSLNGIVNKINVVNVKNILSEVFRENLIRGRGLLCRSLMKSQAASPSFTPVYAALMAVVNTKFPEVGELLLSRLILQFKRSFKRNDKPVCTAAAKFIGHLVNQGVAHEVLALEVLILLLEVPSEDSVEMAVEFVREVGAHLQEVAPQGLHGVFERFRAILHEGSISKRVQFIIEGMFALRKAGFQASGFPALRPELDLVEAEDQITHEMGLESELQAQTTLDVFRVDPNYEEEEHKYAAIARELLGEEEDGEEGGEAGGSEQGGEEGSSEGDDEDDDGDPGNGGGGPGGDDSIQDETATNLVNLRRTIYLTLMSSFDFEEAGHKLLKVGIQPGQEIELVTMIIECCSQERTFKRFYGLLAQRFCYLSRAYAETFEDCFRKQYSVIHRLETNKLRNVSCLFAHLLATDALPWSALTVVRLTEEDTTSSSRIFIKYLFQELSSTMGLVKLNQRVNDPAFSPWFEGLFPRDSLQNMRFSINFFTSIGLGGVTDVMRENYKATVAAQAAAQQQQVAKRMLGSGSGSDSSSSDDSSSSESSSSSSSEDSDSSSDSDSSGDSRRRRGRTRGSGGKKGKGSGRGKGR